MLSDSGYYWVEVPRKKNTSSLKSDFVLEASTHDKKHESPIWIDGKTP